MGLNVSCLQRMKDDETSPREIFPKPSDLSIPSQPPRRIKSIPPPPPRMRAIGRTRAATMDAIHHIDIHHHNQSDNLNLAIAGLRVNIDRNINIIQAKDTPSQPSQPPLLMAMATYSTNPRIMTPSIPSIPTTPPPKIINNNVFDSMTIPKNGSSNTNANKEVTITTASASPSPPSSHTKTKNGTKQTQINVTPAQSAKCADDIITKPCVSNTLCVPNMAKSKRSKRSKRSKSISATMSVTHSNISALSSVASVISTLSESQEAESHSHSHSRTSTATTNSNDLSSEKSCDSHCKHSDDSSYTHTQSKSNASHSSQSDGGDMSTTEDVTDSSSTNNTVLTDDTNTDGHGNEFTPISPGSDDNDIQVVISNDDDNDNPSPSNQTTIIHDISMDDSDQDQSNDDEDTDDTEDAEQSIDTEEIHRKYDERITAAHNHLCLQHKFKSSHTLTTTQISQLSVAIPSSRYGSSCDSSLSQSADSAPTIIVTTPASRKKLDGSSLGIQSPSSPQSAPVTPTSRKGHSEDSRSSIWHSHPTEDELDELDSEDEFDRIQDKEDSSMDKEDSYCRESEDEVNGHEIKVTVNNKIYQSISPKDVDSGMDTSCCEDSEDEPEQEDDIDDIDDIESIGNIMKHERKRSSLLSTISALSKLTKYNKYTGMELIPQRLSTSNKLSSCSYSQTNKQEFKEDYMYIIYKDQEQKKMVKIIYEDPKVLNKHNNALSLTSTSLTQSHSQSAVQTSVMTKDTPKSKKSSCSSPFNDNLTVKSCKSPYGGSFVSRSMKSISTISDIPGPIEQEVLSAYSQSAWGDSPLYSGKLDIDDITKYLQEDEFFSSCDPNNTNTEYVD